MSDLFTIFDLDNPTYDDFAKIYAKNKEDHSKQNNETSSSSVPSPKQLDESESEWNSDINDPLCYTSVCQFFGYNQCASNDISKIDLCDQDGDKKCFTAGLMIVKCVLESSLKKLASMTISTTTAKSGYLEETLKWAMVLTATNTTASELINGDYYKLPIHVQREIPNHLLRYFANGNGDVNNSLISFQRSTSQYLAEHLLSVFVNQQVDYLLQSKAAIEEWTFGMVHKSEQSYNNIWMKLDRALMPDGTTNAEIEYMKENGKSATENFAIDSTFFENSNLQEWSGAWKLKEFDIVTINLLKNCLSCINMPMPDVEITFRLATALQKIGIVKILKMRDWKFATLEDMYAIKMEYLSRIDLTPVIDDFIKLGYQTRLEIIFMLSRGGCKRLFRFPQFESNEFERYMILVRWCYYKNNLPVPLETPLKCPESVKNSFAKVQSLLNIQKLKPYFIKICRGGLFTPEVMAQIAGVAQG